MVKVQLVYSLQSASCSMLSSYSHIRFVFRKLHICYYYCYVESHCVAEERIKVCLPCAYTANDSRIATELTYKSAM